MNEITRTAGLRPNPASDPFSASPFDTQYFRDCNRLENEYDGPIPREAKDAALARAYERLRLRRVAWLEEKIRDAKARGWAIVRLMGSERVVSEIFRLNENVEAIAREVRDLEERLACLQPQQTVDYRRAAE